MSKIKKPDPTLSSDERCKSDACKGAQKRFSFCDDHYEWFKFGLITKEGKKVSDFDKKLAHFEAHVERQRRFTKSA